MIEDLYKQYIALGGVESYEQREDLLRLYSHISQGKTHGIFAWFCGFHKVTYEKQLVKGGIILSDLMSFANLDHIEQRWIQWCKESNIQVLKASCQACLTLLESMEKKDWKDGVLCSGLQLFHDHAISHKKLLQLDSLYI